MYIGQEKLYTGGGSGEFDPMGQEKMIRWDRRSCTWVRRVQSDRTGEND